MNPIILYPKTAAEAKFFCENAEKKGVEMDRVSTKAIEEYEDWLFGAELHRRYEAAKETGKFGTYDDLKAKFAQLINDLEK